MGACDACVFDLTYWRSNVFRDMSSSNETCLPVNRSKPSPKTTGGRHPPLLPGAAPRAGAGPRLSLRRHGRQRRRHHAAGLAGFYQGPAGARCVRAFGRWVGWWWSTQAVMTRPTVPLHVVAPWGSSPRGPAPDVSNPPHTGSFSSFLHTPIDTRNQQSRRPPPQARQRPGASSSCPSTRSRPSSRCVGICMYVCIYVCICICICAFNAAAAAAATAAARPAYCTIHAIENDHIILIGRGQGRLQSADGQGAGARPRRPLPRRARWCV